MEKLEIRAVIKHFCEKGMPPKEIMKTLYKPVGRSLLTVKNRQKSLEDDGRSGHLKDATADENVKVVHTYDFRYVHL